MDEDGQRITEPMLVAAIANQLNDSSAEIKVKDFRISEGSQKGDNFACVMKVSPNSWSFTNSDLRWIKGTRPRVSILGSMVWLHLILKDFF